jgi:hypothetical protein
MASSNGHQKKHTPTNNSSPQNGVAENDGQMREFGAFVANMMSRIELMKGMSPDSRKDIYDSCHLPGNGMITQDMYWNMYDREPVAARVVEVLPKESWQIQPLVYEDEESENVTSFEEDWDSLGTSLRGESYFEEEEGNPVFEHLLRADILSGIGQYGVIVIGIDDKKNLDEPADLTKAGPAATQKLLYLKEYAQQQAKIVEWERDKTNVRHGQPTMYEISGYDPKTYTNQSGVVPPSESVKVHWTRVIHLADGGDVLAPERMRQVFNNLVGCQKLGCSSPEMYFRGAFPGIGFTTHPSLGASVKVNTESLKDTMEKYYQDFQRYFAVWGLQPQQFAPQVVDPSPMINAQIELICIRIGIPIRVFKGSERGELASTQDDAAWNDRLRLRQRTYITPRIIIPFVDRLIQMGVLSEPDGFHVYWPDISSQTNKEKVDVAKAWMEFFAAYISGGVEALIAPLDLLVRYGNMTEEEASVILERAEELAKKKEEEQMKLEAEAAALMQQQAGQGGDDEGEEGQTNGGNLPRNQPPGSRPRFGQPSQNVFCATGEGGGIDPTCSKGGEGAGKGGGGDNFSVRGTQGEDPRFEKIYQQTFGKNVDLKTVAKAANAIDGASVKIEVTKGGGGIQVTAALPGEGVALRTFYRDRDGKLVVQNDYFSNPKTEKGGVPKRGADILHSQVKALQELGVDRIETNAARFDAGNPPLVGYKVWPKLGYSGNIPDDVFDKLPQPIQEAMGKRKGKVFGLLGGKPGGRDIQTLYTIPGGQEAWEKHGTSIDMTFDLSPGSGNVKRLEAYLAERDRRKGN